MTQADRTFSLEYGFFLSGESEPKLLDLKKFLEEDPTDSSPRSVSLPSSRQTVKRLADLSTFEILEKLHSANDLRRQVRLLCEIASLIRDCKGPVYFAPDLTCLDEYCFLALCSDAILTNKPLVSFGFSCRLFMELYLGLLSQFGLSYSKDQLKYERGLWNLATHNITVYVPSRRRDQVIETVSDYSIEHLGRKKNLTKKPRNIESWIQSQGFFDQLSPRFYSRLARKMCLASPLYNLSTQERPVFPYSSELSTAESKLIEQRAANSRQIVSHNGEAIDVTIYVPPKNMIYKLLKNNSKLFLYASGPLSLHEALELFYSRMASVFPPETTKMFRDRNVFWFVSEGDEDDDRSDFWIEWKFFSKDRLKLRIKEQIYFLQKLSENRRDHGYGWLELPNSINEGKSFNSLGDEIDQLRGFSSQYGLGVILTRLPDGMQWTLGEWVSGVFLEHLVKLCADFKIDLNQMFVVLAERGHGRIADDIYWDHFLRGRSDPFDMTLSTHTETSVDDVFKKHDALYISEEARGYGHLKSLKIESKLKKAKILASRLNMVEKLRIDLYLWCLAERVARECTVKGYTENFDEAEILVGEVLGFSRKLCRLSHMDLFYSRERLSSMDISVHE